MQLPQHIEEKLREEWHVQSVNMARKVTDYSTVEKLIADWWLEKFTTYSKENK
jgi:hypothetical protein